MIKMLMVLVTFAVTAKMRDASIQEIFSNVTVSQIETERGMEREICIRVVSGHDDYI